MKILHFYLSILDERNKKMEKKWSFWLIISIRTRMNICKHTLYINICTHTYTNTHTHTNMRIYVYVSIHAHIHIRTDTCTHTHTHVHSHTHVHTRVHIYVSTHVVLRNDVNKKALYFGSGKKAGIFDVNGANSNFK